VDMRVAVGVGEGNAIGEGRQAQTPNIATSTNTNL
jgi:hypothetical protein